MLKVYVKTGCPYCTAVLAKLNDLDLPFEELNVSDPAIEADLVKRGGTDQTPYLADEDKDVGLYESAGIMSYLDATYGGMEEGHR